ncbi:MAG: P1 family peptidase [Maricaulaceae bacterium]|jgi:L-aminopeptidase/D-esterase-like protein
MAAPGPRNLITDVEGLTVGNAHDDRVRTGVTVIRPAARAVASVDVRGGGPGTRETDLLSPENLVDAVDAIVLTGGSVYGLAAADGVVAALGAAGQGFVLKPGAPPSPIAPAAVLYDLANGGEKDWGEIPPYAMLGRTALEAAGETFDLGRAGAGFGASAGAGPGGLGSTSVLCDDGLTVGAIVAVNSFGAVRMPGSDAFWAWPYEQQWDGAGEFGDARPATIAPPLDLDDWGAAKINPYASETGRTNTTIAVVATNAALTAAQARRVAIMAQAGLTRAIRPVNAPTDGDVVFALSTAVRSLDEPAPLALTRIGSLAADCLARAVARGVWLAEQQSP